MLTKHLLKYKLRSGQVKPAFVAPDDKDALSLAEQLIALFEASVGQTIGELEDSADAIVDELGVGRDLAAGLSKLLLDRCDEQPDDAGIEELRWRLLAASQRHRSSGAATSPEAMRQAVALEVGLAASAGETLPDQLYADLPSLRRVAGFKPLSARELLEHYNRALVQGLLLHARRVSVTLKDASLADKRAVFRALKFHRLMAEVESAADDKSLTFTLSGPLTLIEQAQTYGLRLATFFPHVLHIAKWALSAELQLKKKNVVLKLDQKSGLVSSYQKSRPYVPEEMTACLGSFNKQYQEKDWSVEVGEDFVHIGHQSYCFPDLTLRSTTGKRLHIELFHRWHAAQLAGRLQALEKSPIPSFFIGISKSLQKNPKVASLLKESRWFERNGFVFGEFPTPKHLISLASVSDSMP